MRKCTRLGDDSFLELIYPAAKFYQFLVTVHLLGGENLAGIINRMNPAKIFATLGIVLGLPGRTLVARTPCLSREKLVDENRENGFTDVEKCLENWVKAMHNHSARRESSARRMSSGAPMGEQFP